MTPEEQRWKASAFNPEKARKKLKYGYITLGIWVACIIAWIVVKICKPGELSWWTLAIFAGTFLNFALSIINSRRIVRGKKPFLGQIFKI